MFFGQSYSKGITGYFTSDMLTGIEIPLPPFMFLMSFSTYIMNEAMNPYIWLVKIMKHYRYRGMVCHDSYT
jgi:uncharacterized protein YmfQ (DUF2313 family)